MILTENTPWILPESISEPIDRAIKDLANDWYMVFGAEPLMMKEANAPAVIFGGIEAPTDRESFALKVKSGNLCLRVYLLDCFCSPHEKICIKRV